MRRCVRMLTAGLCLMITMGTSSEAQAQSSSVMSIDRGGCIVIPQARSRVSCAVEMRSVGAHIEIVDQLATTTLEFELFNTTGQPQEAQVIVPVPEGVSIRSFQYDGTGPEPTATLISVDDARRMYSDIVRSMKDPGLLEFVGSSAVKSSVFPIPARTTQKVRITYEQLLIVNGNRVDYVLPRSESLTSAAVPWSIRGKIASTRPIATVYCPSHNISVSSQSEREVVFSVPQEIAAAPGWLRLSYLLRTDAEQPTVSMVMYPDATVGSGEGGYFLMLLAPPERSQVTVGIRREMTIVLDRSGSMKGEKFEQAVQAARMVIDGLKDGERFNIIDYSDTVASFSLVPVEKGKESLAKAHAYLASLSAGGGTNLHDALMEALRAEPSEGTLPIVLFLTDGVATVGVTDEKSIRDAMTKTNTHARRVFTFGVGYDVNSALLTAVASTSRGSTTFVMPGENVETKVSDVYRRLDGPVLTTPKLTTIDEDGKELTSVVRDCQPTMLSDFFAGEQVVVLGRYTKSGKLRLRLEGMSGDVPRSMTYAFDTSSASVRNGFVPRLWAARRIGALIDSVRQLGATPGVTSSDPNVKELVDEIVALSKRFGVMTEYTAFLATDPNDRNAQTPIPASAAPAFARSSMNIRNERRSGAGSLNQDYNLVQSQNAVNVAATRAYRDAKMEQVEVTSVQYLNDQTILRRGTRWVDARLVEKEAEAPERVVEFGTDEYFEVVRVLERDGLQGLLTNTGELYVLIDGQRTLIRNPS